MDIEPIRLALRGAPVIKLLVQWLQERGVEVAVLPRRQDHDPFWAVQVLPGQPVTIYAYFRLRVVNNRTDRSA